MSNETGRSVGSGGGDFSMEETVELRMSDGSYRSVSSNDPVEPPHETVKESKPKAVKFSITPEWTWDFVRGRIENVGGIYASTTIMDGSGWAMSDGIQTSYIVSVGDWNACIGEASDKLRNLSVESSQLMFSEHTIEDDPILGPLIALVA